MYKYQLTIISFCLIVFSASSQSLVLDIHKNKSTDFIKIEKALGSMPVKIDFQPDSTIDHLLYEWDESNLTKYKTLYTQIFQTYGVSKSEGNLDNLAAIDTWRPDDSTEIKLSIDPTYRIQLQVKNIVSQRRVNDEVLRAFLSELQNKNYSKAKTYLSPRISNTITTQQFEGLSKNIRFDDTLVIYSVGTERRIDLTTNGILQYQYKSDQNQPPKELIRVMFDANNKILGIEPTSSLPTNTNQPGNSKLTKPLPLVKP